MSEEQEGSLVTALRQRAEVGKKICGRGELSPGNVRMWSSSVRHPLRKIFGADSQVVATWPSDAPVPAERVREVLLERVARLELLIESISSSALRALGASSGKLIFIGHGRSAAWRELKDFLQDRLRLPWAEFNSESVAGVSTTERLERMLESAAFAFLVMTGDDEHADATFHARENVVHEVGLFQGRLGTKRAIILREEGCQVFSNIHGLTYISFPKGHIQATFEEIRRVLERERLIEP
jgi:hypothetical protein